MCFCCCLWHHLLFTSVFNLLECLCWNTMFAFLLTWCWILKPKQATPLWSHLFVGNWFRCFFGSFKCSFLNHRYASMIFFFFLDRRIFFLANCLLIVLSRTSVLSILGEACGIGALVFVCYFFMCVFFSEHCRSDKVRSYSWKDWQLSWMLFSLLKVELQFGNKVRTLSRLICSSNCFSKTAFYVFSSWHFLNTDLNALYQQNVKTYAFIEI